MSYIHLPIQSRQGVEWGRFTWVESVWGPFAKQRGKEKKRETGNESKLKYWPDKPHTFHKRECFTVAKRQADVTGGCDKVTSSTSYVAERVETWAMPAGHRKTTGPLASRWSLSSRVQSGRQTCHSTAVPGDCAHCLWVHSAHACWQELPVFTFSPPPPMSELLGSISY